MTFTCRYFADGSQYGQKDFARFMLDAFDDGYVSNVGNGLKCTSDGTDMRIAVSTGRGYIHGYSFDVSDSPEYVTLPPADPTNDRIDRVVARLSPDVNKNITLTYVQGTPASTPVAPALTRTDQTWEISLAQVKVPHGSSYIPSANVTDERNDYSVCGCADNVDSARIDRGTVNYQRLPTATASTVGVIKPGYGLQVESDGTLKATKSELNGYFAQNNYGHISIQLKSGATVTPTTTDNSTISGATVTYDVTATFSTDLYTAKLSISPCDVDMGVDCYSWRDSPTMGRVPCISVTANLLKDGIVVETKTGANIESLKFDTSATLTVDDLINHTWKITGTAELSGARYYYYTPTIKQVAMEYLIIE